MRLSFFFLFFHFSFSPPSLAALYSISRTKMALRANRMARELKLLSSEPPPGVAVWPVGDGIGELRAQLRVRKTEREKREREETKRPFRACRFFLLPPLFFSSHSHSFSTLSLYSLPIPILTHSHDRVPRERSTREARLTSA